jgi:hypothetical protein
LSEAVEEEGGTVERELDSACFAMGDDMVTDTTRGKEEERVDGGGW